MITPEDIAAALAGLVDNDYHESLEASLSAHAEDASIVLTVRTYDGAEPLRFRAVLVEVVSE